MPEDSGQNGGVSGNQHDGVDLPDSGPQNPENQPNREVKKRKRRRWKKINEDISQEKRENLKQNFGDKDVDKASEEPAGEPEPINPFADFDFASASKHNVPPKKPEEHKSEKVEHKEPEKEPELVNPFEEESFSPPIEERPLEDKPLDQISEEGKDEDVFKYDEAKELESDKMEKNDEFQEGEIVDNYKSEPVAPELEPEAVKVHEPAVNPEVTDQGAVKKDEFHEIKSEIWDILEQAGITKKTLMWFGIIFVIGLFFIFAFLFGWFSDGDGEPVANDEPVAEDTQVPEDTEPSDEPSDETTPSFLFGESLPISSGGNIDGVNAAFIFGGLFESEKVRFAYYMNLINDLNNIYTTDVYLLLDMSVDRRAALERHLLQMNNLILEGEKALAEIDLILQNLDRTYNSIAVNRDLHEEQFFTFTQNLRGNSAYNSLELFIGFAQDGTRVKAYFNGYELIFQAYQNVLAVIKPRYQDIVVNREAVIKGVRVFDVPSSDIKAIIPLSN